MGMGAGRGMNWGFGVRMCKLLHIIDEQQGPTINHKESYSIL